MIFVKLIFLSGFVVYIYYIYMDIYTLYTRTHTHTHIYIYIYIEQRIGGVIDSYVDEKVLSVMIQDSNLFLQDVIW